MTPIVISSVNRGGKMKVDVRIPKIKLKGLRPREIDELMKILLDDVKQDTPYDSGQLQKGIRKRKTATGGELYIQGKRNNEVAGYLIEGTKRHFIKPKGRKPLAWIGAGGEWFYSRGHWVKGIKKGYWKFKPSVTAMKNFRDRIKLFLKAK